MRAVSKLDSPRGNCRIQMTSAYMCTAEHKHGLGQGTDQHEETNNAQEIF